MGKEYLAQAYPKGILMHEFYLCQLCESAAVPDLDSQYIAMHKHKKLRIFSIGPNHIIFHAYTN
jgi:hypothetical protein